MLLPALAKAKAKAQGVQCMNNFRQLTIAWRVYADENGDRLVAAYGTDKRHTWVQGSLDFNPGNADNWSLKDITNSPLWPYCGRSSAIWKCPADQSIIKPTSGEFRGRTVPRVRSMSMNNWFNGTLWTSGYRQYIKLGDVGDPGPSLTWVLLDEREDSINDGEFCVDMTGYDPPNPKALMIVDYPASYHNGAAGFSFADTHAEFKKWLDPRTTPRLRKGQTIPLNIPSQNNRDVQWMQERSTRKSK
jgi:prepilin-type processing-associated H-X9-DG protein